MMTHPSTVLSSEKHAAESPPEVPGNRFVHLLRTSRPLRLLVRNVPAMIAFGFILLVLFLTLFGSAISPHDPNVQNLSNSLAAPSGEHWLGTDVYGRDMFSRLLASAHVTLLAVVQAVGVAAVIGIPTGLFAGLVGGWLGGVISRISDALQSLPPLILAVAIIGIFGPGLTNAMVAIGLVMAPSLYRLARGAAESVATETYIEAARALGCGKGRLMWSHVLPNAASPLLVQLSFSAGVAIVAEASLSFLGLGVQAPQTSWGSMVREAFDNVYVAPGLIVAPAVMIVLTVLAFSTFGDGLRDALEGSGKVEKK